MLEIGRAGVEGYLIRRVAQMGGETRKVVWPGRRGAPDRLVLLPAVVDTYCARHGAWFIELKRPKGGRLEPHQVREINLLKGYGLRVAVLWSPQMIDSWLAGSEVLP